MANVSRRDLLKQASLGVAAGAVATTGVMRIPDLLNAGVGHAAGTDLSPVGSDVIVHVRDASTGEVEVLVGERGVVAHDPELVSRLLRVARSATVEA